MTAITKNGVTRLAAPPALDLGNVKSDKKIEDEEILKLLEQPVAKPSAPKAKKNKKKKKKPAKKAEAKPTEEEDDDEDDDDDDDEDDE